MPYFIQANGTSVWYEPGEEPPADPSASTPAADSETKGSATAVVEKPEEKGDEQEAANNNKEFEDKYLKGYTPPPPTEAKQRIQPNERSSGTLLGPMPDTGTRPTFAEASASENKKFKEFIDWLDPAGLPKGIYRTIGGASRLPNDLFAFLQHMGMYQAKYGTSLGYGSGMSDAVTRLVNPELADRREEILDRTVGAELRSLEKTGRLTNRDALGFPSSWGPIHHHLSPEGAGWKKHFDPKHWGEDLLQKLSATIVLDKGIGAVFKGALAGGAKINYLKGFYKSVIGQKSLISGLDDLGHFTVREIFPDLFQSATVFRPGTNPEFDDKAYWVNSLPNGDMQEWAWKAILAEDETDWSYSEEQFKELAFGAAAIPIFHTLLLGGRKVVQGVRKSIAEKGAQLTAKDIDNVVSTASKETAKESAETLDAVLDDTVRKTAAEQEALVTRDIADKTDVAGRNISKGLRAGFKRFDETRKLEVPQIEKLTKELDSLPDETKEINLLEGEIEDLRNALGVKNNNDITNRLNKLAEDYDHFEALERPVKLNKVIDEISDLIRLREFEQAYEEATTRLLRKTELETLIAKSSENIGNSRIGLGNAINDGKTLLRTIGELVDLRSNLIDLQESRLVRDPNYPGIKSTGKYREYPGALGEAQRELNELLQTIESAQAGGELSEELIAQFIRRADEIEMKIANNGGLKPVISEAAESTKKGDEPKTKTKDKPETKPEVKVKKGAKQVIEDPWAEPTEGAIEAPTKENPVTGDLEVDHETVNARQSLTPETPTRTVDKVVEAQQINKDLNIDQVPSAQELDRQIKERLEYQSKLQELDDADGGKRTEESLSLSRQIPRLDGKLSTGANAMKLDPTAEGQALIKLEFDQLQAENLNPILVKQALRELGSYLGGGAEILTRKEEFLKEATKVGTEFYINAVPKIIVSMSLIRSSTASLLRSVRDMRNVASGVNQAMDKDTALRNFLDNYRLFRQNLAAIDSFYQGVGNAMRYFGPEGKLSVFDNVNPVKTIKEGQVFTDQDELRKGLESIGIEFKRMGEDGGTFASRLKEQAERAKVEVKNELDEFLRKWEEGTLTSEDYMGVARLMENIELAKGNMAKLRDTALTSKELMATLHTGHVLSNWAFPASIPAMGHIGMNTRLAARWGQHFFSGNFERVLVRFGLGNEEEIARQFAQARHARRWLTSSHLFHMEGLNSALNSFLFNKSIADPLQAKRADVGLSTNRLGSMTREEAILASRRGEIEHNTIWAKWLVERFKDDPKVLRAINEIITLGKVFHDYAIPGEAWKVKGLADDGSKNVGTVLSKAVSWPVEASQSITSGIRTGGRNWSPGDAGQGIGTKSYFPAGERTNLSLFAQLASAGDEGITAQYTRAALYADAIEVVDQKIADGVIPIKDRTSSVLEEFNRVLKEKSQAIPAGFDQETVGFSILDERSLDMIRSVNQTEALTGPLGSIKNAIELLRNDTNPQMRYMARFIWPIINSPLIAVKLAAKYAYGLELWRPAVDATRYGVGQLSDKLMANKVINNFADTIGGKQWLQKNVIDFESDYFSKDPAIRDKARNAFALAAGIQAVVASIVWNPNNEVTGGLDDTYQIAGNRAERFRWLIGGHSIPYRYIPLFGEAIAFQTSMRDIVQFNPDYDAGSFFTVFQSAMAAQVLDMPGVTGIHQALETINKTMEGDGDAVIRYLSKGYTRLSAPYTESKKSFRNVFLDNAKANTTLWQEPRGYKRGRLHTKEGPGPLESVEGFVRSVGSIAGENVENEFGFFLDHIRGAFNGDKSYRLSTRKAVPYGRPNEVVRAETGPFYVPWETMLGRFWWGNNDLTDPVNEAIMKLQLSAPDNALYNTYNGRTVGIGINDTELNNFNHFFNTEFTFTARGKTYTGINAYIRDLVKNKKFVKYDDVDSPYRADMKGNWISGKTEEVKRRTILMSNINEQLNKAKIQYLLGRNPNQQFKASESLKKAVLSAISPQSAGSN